MIDPNTFSAAAATDIAQKDTNRLVGSVAKALAANSPFMNVLSGGTFESGVSDTVRASIQLQAAPGDSLAAPTFTPSLQLATTNVSQELTEAINLTYTLEGKRGLGPKVNVKQGFAAFKTSYLAAEDSLKKLITQYLNADIRYNLLNRSGSKFTVATGHTFGELFTGGQETDTGVGFAPAVGGGFINPDSTLSFKALHAILRYGKEALFGEFFGSEGKGMQHARFIAGADQIEFLRAEVNPQLTALTTGQYKLGEEGLTGYSFETSPAYRGLAFAVDQRPLRFAAFGDGTTGPLGKPILLNPVSIVTNGTTGAAHAIPNPAWVNAAYEIGFLIFDGTFERQVPEKYVGEGSFKFAPQLHMGELEWHFIKDSTNMYGDWGWHKYQIERAYRPKRPQHVIPIAYKRCTADLGLTAC